MSKVRTWANARINWFFEGRPRTLDGQCVSLIKWFLQDLTSVPDPQAARGHAKDFGDTLVNQGHAIRVTAPQAGDLAVWKQDGGGYGHIALCVGIGEVFEQNVGLQGIPSKVVAGNTVYASRIRGISQPWRKGAVTYYRVKSYQENNQGGSDVETIKSMYLRLMGREADQGGINTYTKAAQQKGWEFVYNDLKNSAEGQADWAWRQPSKVREKEARIADLEKQLSQKPKEVIVEKPVEVIKEVVKEIEVIKEVPVEKIVEVVKGDDERSLGDLLMAAFNKLFKVK